MKRVSHTRRGEVVYRSLAASLGGYGATYAFTGALALLLPMAPAEAVYLAAMLSFAVYVALVIWTFSAGTIRQAWALPLLLTGLSALVWLWHGVTP